MSATSGIGVNEDLVARFSAAIEAGSIRFIKVSIQNETLVHDLSVPVQSSFDDDLAQLQGSDIIQDDIAAYILAKLDGEGTSEWLAISYVPDTAKVRDKMLYASTRASLLKSLGSKTFTDSIFATSKTDLTPDAYAKHRAHVNAPKPLSSREQEMADIRAAERDATVGGYAGAKAVATHIGSGVGMQWAVELQDAVKELGDSSEYGLLVVKVDMSSETLVLGSSTTEVTADTVGSLLPSGEPCYAFFAWPRGSQRDIVFIYSCPSTSSVKYRMIYSTGTLVIYRAAVELLADSQSKLVSRKIETADPAEINEKFLIEELGLSGTSDSPAATPQSEQPKAFAKPRGPARRK